MGWVGRFVAVGVGVPGVPVGEGLALALGDGETLAPGLALAEAFAVGDTTGMIVPAARVGVSVAAPAGFDVFPPPPERVSAATTITSPTIATPPAISSSRAVFPESRSSGPRSASTPATRRGRKTGSSGG